MSRKIPCVLMRGGSSRGPFFLATDLPNDDDLVDRILIAVMGSPNSLQIDGLGGGHPLTSKVAIVSRSTINDADIDYLFVQVRVERALVDRSPNCGNMLSAVGPFAIEAGLIAVDHGETTVRIRNLNTGSIIDQVVQTPLGIVRYDGDFALDGVPGTASPIRLRFREDHGQKNRLLPAGEAVTRLDGIDATLISGAIPVMILRAADVGLTGYETATEFEARLDIRQRIETLRRLAGYSMGLGNVSDSVVPKVALLAPARHGGTLTVRYLTPDRYHATLAVTGGTTIARSLLVPGSISQQMAPNNVDGLVRLEHPAGEMPLKLEYGLGPGGAEAINISLVRSARRIFEGHVIIPSAIWPASVDVNAQHQAGIQGGNP